MKFLLQLIVINSFVFSPLYAGIKRAGTEINNGGAGISINGNVATFYSAEMQVNPEPLKTTPTMEWLNTLIKGLNLPHRVKLELSQNILPSFDRKYYAVTQDSIDQLTLEIIKKEYSKITKTSSDNIAIFALTDSETKITLLLPDFFKLNESEKMAILFHESLWINERVKSYENMLEIERDTQIYVMYQDDCIPRYNLTKQLENIFNEKLWALNSIFNCQTSKFRQYATGLEMSFNDFASSLEMNTLAQIILTKYFKMPENNQLYELFLNQINTDPDFKVFQASKAELVEILRDENTSISIEFNGRSLPFDSTPLSQNNIKLLAQNLSTSNMLYGFSDYNIFNMILLNHYTSVHMRINIKYNPPNKNHATIAE